jgi:hypothetical protein
MRIVKGAICAGFGAVMRSVWAEAGWKRGFDKKESASEKTKNHMHSSGYSRIDRNRLHNRHH